MESPGRSKTGNIWKRFCDDERASSQIGWGLLIFLVWIATESLLAFS